MIFLYGPSGSGKSAIGRLLAESLNLAFYDLDDMIKARSGKSIPEIFSQDGEPGFRNQECNALVEVIKNRSGVVALGGGTLLDPMNRSQVETAGMVLCLSANINTLIDRLSNSDVQRPLLTNINNPRIDGSGDSATSVDVLRQRLEGLIVNRTVHYDSFPVQLDTSSLTVGEATWEVQIRLGVFHVRGMAGRGMGNLDHGYDVIVQKHGIDHIGRELPRYGLYDPIAIVSDEIVSTLYASPITNALKTAGFSSIQIDFPTGEQFKSIEIATHLWQKFSDAGLERGSLILALGGGVVNDLAGFSASTYMRGVDWIGVPTTLLAMVDASLGGKTGINLPQGKNLVGTFYPPRLVVADPIVLETLPVEELRAGLAEVVKAGIVGDPLLFERCAQGWEEVSKDWVETVRRAIAVKVKVIQADPYEKGYRSVLNYGHTIGHALERVSGYSLRHGEAVAMGMVAEAKLAEGLGITKKGLARIIEKVLVNLGLPTTIPAFFDPQAILEATRTDKKRRQGVVRFALPVRIGKVQVGIEADNREVIAALTE